MNDKIRILVAEDHLVARVGVTTIVNMQHDMTVVAEAANGQQAVEMFRHAPAGCDAARPAHARNGRSGGGDRDPLRVSRGAG